MAMELKLLLVFLRDGRFWFVLVKFAEAHTLLLVRFEEYFELPNIFLN
jgi:hypothetical protein